MNDAAAPSLEEPSPRSVPAPRPTGTTGSESRGGQRPLSVAVDATPMLGPRTGVGMMTGALVERLARDDTVDLSGYVVSWRGRQRHRAILPDRCRPHWVPWPARISHHLWRHIDYPRLGTRFDVVHGTNYVVPPAPGAARLVTVHDLTAWRFPELVDGVSAANPTLLERALDRGAHVHCVSRSVAEELAADVAVAADRIHVIPNGVDPTRPGDPEKGRNRVGGRYVVAVGTIEPRKDYVGLVEAMQGVWARHDDLKLAIIGADGWGVDAFEAAVGRLNARSRIVRCGYVSEADKADLLAGAELLAFPSLYEGFGLPLLEAMQAGLAVVSTNVGAIPEVAGDAAHLVAPGSPDDLTSAMLTVIEDPDVRRTMVDRGHQRVKRFSWDTTAAAMADLYRELAGERASRPVPR